MQQIDTLPFCVCMAVALHLHSKWLGWADDLQSSPDVVEYKAAYLKYMMKVANLSPHVAPPYPSPQWGPPALIRTPLHLSFSASPYKNNK